MRKISKKQIGAMGLAVMMTAQSTAMAAEIETSQTETTVVTQEVSQEDFQEEATVAEDVSAAEQVQNRRLFQSKILLWYKKRCWKKMQ